MNANCCNIPIATKINGRASGVREKERESVTSDSTHSNKKPTNTMTTTICNSRKKNEARVKKRTRNLVKQKIHRCTKFDEMWRALTYRTIFHSFTPKRHTRSPSPSTQLVKNMCASQTNIYFSYFRVNEARQQHHKWAHTLFPCVVFVVRNFCVCLCPTLLIL